MARVPDKPRASDMTKKLKKRRLYKLAKEFNVSTETLGSHLKRTGHADALAGSGFNMSIQTEEAYAELRNAFASDKEIADRVQKKRDSQVGVQTQREAPKPAEVVQPQPEPPAVVTEEAPPAVEVDLAEKEVAEGVREAVVESVVLPDDPSQARVGSDAEIAAVDGEAGKEVGDGHDAKASTAVVDAGDEHELADPAEAVRVEPAAIADVDEVVQVESPLEAVEARLEEPATEEVLAQDAKAPEIPVEEPTDEEPLVDGIATDAALEEGKESKEGEESREGEEGHGEALETITAKRYRLAGTKVLGTMDLSEVEREEPRKRERKRKRKRKVVPTVGGEGTSPDAPARPAVKRKKRRKGADIDEGEIEETVQRTLREIEMGTGRSRQRRRRLRRERHAEQREQELEEQLERDRILRVTEFVSTGELANLMDVPVKDVIQTLFESGMIVSINQRLDADTISYVADEFDYQVDFITEFGTDDIVLEEDDPEDMQPRAPIVTVMGHVDHGKTSLLDYIRNANVVAGEAGGITQHIGAHKVALPDGRDITFLDTPGHEAFTAMRARGAKATDVVVLVVAADDAVMPQTLEAINHARAAEVPIVVAVNKIDKPEANAQKVIHQLSEQNVLVEQYGGKVQCAFVSAHTGEGVDDLLEKILLESELMDLQANPDRRAAGVVVESQLEKGRGNVATILVRNGTLRVGDDFIAGIFSGRVRAMFDEREHRLEEAGPSQPALVLGLNGSPEAGDQFVGLESEKEAREISQRRQQIHREQFLRQKKHITLDEIGRRLALGDFRELKLIIKADVGGSVEALGDSLLKLSTEEVALNIIHSGVGAITESDVMLASASDAVIIGFQVRPAPGARQLAEREEIDIRTYSIIYDAIEDVHDALEGLLSPEEKEVTTGTAEVRDLFKVPKVGTVAGCYVVEGKIRRKDFVRVIREGVVIYQGEPHSLKRFKEDVQEVPRGYECGISIQAYNDLKVGDHVESYEIVEEKRTLAVS